MRCVANDASFGLHRSVFKDERSGFVGVAAKTDLVLGGGRAKLARQESAMWIVTIAARHQAFVHAMVDWFGKLRLDFKMAAVAQHRLGHRQKSAFYFGMMSRVAVNASNVILQVL